jgi:pre-rRNA-processing protein TSR4
MRLSSGDDWSDSDEDIASVDTPVLLGVPDGPIETESDLRDSAVSRIGGKPVRDIPHVQVYHRPNIRCLWSQAFLSPDIPFESSHCKHCNLPMELLVQMWCPLEDSPYDRTLYVWGCSRNTCQRQRGT